MAEKCKCTDCLRLRPAKEFWKSNNLEMYPEGGRVDLCRSCLTKGIEDLKDWRSVREVFKVLDFPFIEDKWEQVVNKRLNGESYDDSTTKKKAESITKVVGDYARIMKLGKYMKMSYKDSDAILSLLGDAESIVKEKEATEEQAALDSVKDSIDSSLTVEERSFLMTKWNTSDLNDIMYLENYYLGMMEDYEINTTSHKDYLKKIAVVSLELDKALKSKDWDTVKTLRITFSSFMKEADFTAAQANKDKSDFVSSFGEVAAFLETMGFIDVIDLTYPRDMVDRTIGNLNSYTRDLVLNESGLGDLLEGTIKLMNAPEEDEEADYEFDTEDMWKDDLEIDWDKEEEEEEEDKEKKDDRKS